MHSYLGAWSSLLIFRELLEYQMFASYYFPESYWQCRWSDFDEAFWYVPLLKQYFKNRDEHILDYRNEQIQAHINPKINQF